MTDHLIGSAEALRDRYGQPSRLAAEKAIDHIDRHCRRFIELSPFLVLATSASDGTVDASPRGDAPGFVRVEDERTLLLPDRRGNRRVDSLENLVSNPHVGLLFLIPGVNETLRVNGTATITTDPGVLASMSVRERTPESAIRVSVEEAFLQCTKALVRSALWNADRQVDRKSLPTFGEMLADHVGDLDAGETEARVQESARTTLY